MSIFLFLGPTLPAEAAHALLARRGVAGARVLPPVAQGDVYAAASAGARVIGIVDGYFERVPAVWHKEILWALARGVHVIGAASMGALRAAELHTLGMEGVGAVFEGFRDGMLEDDDEVTIVHAAAEHGFRAASDAMVDIRATVEAAIAQAVIDRAAGTRLVAHAKALHYPRRRWAALLDAARDRGDADAAAALEAWLPAGAVQRKRLDAIALVERVAALVAEGPPRKEVTFRFQHTDAWEQVRRQIDRRPLDTLPGAATLQHDAVLDELRLAGSWPRVVRDAQVRALALQIADHDGDEPGDDAVARTVHALRTRAGIASVADFEAWLEAQVLTADELARIVLDETRVQRVLAVAEGELPRHIADRLRFDDAWAALARRARHKQETLARRGLENPSLRDLDIDEPALWRWFFRARPGTAGSAGGTLDAGAGHRADTVPADSAVQADLADAARELGFETVDALRRAVLREWCFVQGSAAG